MSKLRTAIDHKSLELELQEALRADELYRLQNDAKLRAVEQNVPTYEDFRQMVLAAHLKPLQHADLRPKIKPWNSVVNTDNSNAISVLDKLKENQSKDCLKSLNNSDNTSEGKIPTTYEEFVTVWKSMKTYRKKFDYLKNIRHILHKKIFRAEIPATLLVEIINVCLQNISITDNTAAIVDILNILSKCNRFSLAVNFMGHDEREMCTRLFHQMLSSVEHKNEMLEDKIKTLELIYGVTFK